MAEFQNPFFTSASEDVEAEYVAGVLALQNGDYYAAIRCFGNAAREGHVSESDSKLSALISCSCYAAGEELDRGDKQPCRCRGDGLLEVLGQAAVAAEPCKGPLDHPASGQDLEALGVV